ncbi:hypothetical protein TIFTF001_036054 [Ficus carica]|uniref:Uncharacterized protein n=1 Tax=Ficus carica TaxID=3494 RepID=A0AA88E2Y8_FICCA|nr:hypothetical protein TIFTF001_036054 [Ficus carica]
MSSSIPVGMFVDCTTCLYYSRWSCGSDIPSNLGKEMLPNLGVMVLVMRLVSGISLTPRARSSNPGVDVVALCICDEKRCSICASSVLISSNIKLLIISSMFIVPCGMGPSVGGGKSGVERCVGVFCLLALDLAAVYLYCASLSFTTGVSSGANSGCIGVIGL